jgi:hypothetical protein
MLVVDGNGLQLRYHLDGANRAVARPTQHTLEASTRLDRMDAPSNDPHAVGGSWV